MCACNQCQREKRRQARGGPPAPVATSPPAPPTSPPTSPAAPPALSVVAVEDAPEPESAPTTNIQRRPYKPSVKVPAGQYGKVPTDRVLPFQGQPRIHFDPVRLQELADSIEAEEQQQPATVRWFDDDPEYSCELVDGERRWRACQTKGLPLRVLVVNVESLEQHFAMSAISNFNREPHTALEIAQGSKRLLEDKWTVAKVAKGFGRSVAYINQCLLLMKLAPEVQALLHPDLPRNEGLRTVVAVALARYSDEFQKMLAREIIEGKLGATAAHEHIRARARETGQVATTQRKKVRSPREDYKNLTSRLTIARTRLGLLQEMDPETMKEMFAHRDPADHAAVIEELQDLGESVEGLVASFRALQPREEVGVA